MVRVCCGAPQAHVCAGGPILHLSELLYWREALVRSYTELSGTAHLDCAEPHLDVTIVLKDGRGTMVVLITPDHLSQEHKFTFEIDQSYLPELTRALGQLMEKYPIRGKRDEE